MQRWLMVLALGLTFGCSHNPNKAEKIDANGVEGETVTGNETVGVNAHGDMVVQKKVAMADELRRLQYEVYELEDRVYGNKQYGSKGLYGALKDCRSESVSRRYGGDGKLVWTEPMDRVTEHEESWNIGLDENKRLVGVSEEFLRDRLSRFKNYKETLKKRESEYEEKLEICDADLKTKREQAGPSAAQDN